MTKSLITRSIVLSCKLYGQMPSGVRRTMNWRARHLIYGFLGKAAVAQKFDQMASNWHDIILSTQEKLRRAVKRRQTKKYVFREYWKAITLRIQKLKLRNQMQMVKKYDAMSFDLIPE